MMKKILFSLLALNLFFLQCYLFRFSIYAYPSNLQEILLGLNFLVFLLVKGPKVFLDGVFRHRILSAFVLLSGFSLVTVPLLDPLSALRFVKFLFFGGLLTFLFLETYQSEAERYKGLRIFAYGALFFGIFSAIYNLLGFNVMLDQRLAGPLDSAVYLAVYLLPAFLFFAFEWIQAPKSFKKGVPFLIVGLLLLATRSFGAVGGGLVVLFLFTLKNSNLPFLKSPVFKVFAGSFAILFVVGAFYFKILPTLQTTYSSLDERGEIWQTTVELLKEPKSFFLGLGFGQFQAHYQESVAEVLGREPLDYVVLQPHNIFLLFLVHYGFLGLLLLFYLMILTVQAFFKEKKDSVQTFAVYVLIYFFIHGLIDTPLFKNDLLFLFLLFLELGVGPVFLKKNKAKLMPGEA